MSAGAPPGSKRRIGGHFGAALGASTNVKRQRGGWRDEVEDEPAANGTADGSKEGGEDDDSDSEAMLDPGTPLPSEEEEEAAPPAAPETGAAEGESSAAEASAVSSAPAEKAEAAENGSAKEAPLADQAPAGPSTERGVVFTLEVIVGKNTCGKLRVLLPRGLDRDAEQRLSACAPPEGETSEAWGEVDFIKKGCYFGFAGHATPGAKKEKKKPVESEVEAGLPVAGIDSMLTEAPAPAVTNGHTGLSLHTCAGLLTSPKDGSGLALTLSPQAALDETHRVIGHVLLGRRCFRHLEAIAPVSLEAKPRVPVFLRLPKMEQDEASRPHPFLDLEPFRQSASVPFAEDTEAVDAALAPEEIIELADVELSGRDVEVSDLKQTTFSRERQTGVTNVEDALAALLQRLESLENLDETLSGQRVWVQEGGNRLLRVLKKLH
eukprot:TRINITY_DN77769_c0_g1_i1.p1 TRINITY_DN77769_c0_g1~~TRINITY_DN77769_c0_g1_i1.p1  ORF type:complete len:436 (+),score=125.59 TRINITY_DN77769_c0_g1_i1:42-1349(+)